MIGYIQRKRRCQNCQGGSRGLGKFQKTEKTVLAEASMHLLCVETSWERAGVVGLISPYYMSLSTVTGRWNFCIQGSTLPSLHRFLLVFSKDKKFTQTKVWWWFRLSHVWLLADGLEQSNSSVRQRYWGGVVILSPGIFLGVIPAAILAAEPPKYFLVFLRRQENYVEPSTSGWQKPNAKSYNLGCGVEWWGIDQVSSLL